MNKMIDSHIHLDHYSDEESHLLMANSSSIEALISVSFHLDSCKRNLELAKQYSKVKSAFGYHPEQPLPTVEQREELLKWIRCHQKEMIAIGEVGLPYYLRTQNQTGLQIEEYVELLEHFIILAKEIKKPIILHAVYDDAPIACDLLEKHSISNAHFHWFKGDSNTIHRMIQNGYYISVTPDILYEEEIAELVQLYPLSQMMVETDGPWPFEGPFQGKLTHPKMMRESVKMIADIKNVSENFAYERLFTNTNEFYSLQLRTE